MIDHNKAPKILGVNPNASRIEIKRAYNNLSKTYHPDKYKGNDIKFASNQFSIINEAYNIMMSNNYQNRNKNYQRGIFYDNRNKLQPYARRQVDGDVNVLCNGNVLMTGNFHPSKLSYEMLMNMRKNIK